MTFPPYIITPVYEKPLFDNDKGYKIYLWDKYLTQARKYKKPLKIRVQDVGEGIYTADEWETGADYMEKIFNRPDEPMKLVGNYFRPTEIQGSNLNEGVLSKLASNKDLMAKLGR